MKVVTAVVNNPIFIEIQYHTLKKYLDCDYEFIVFNDAKEFPDFTNGENPTIKNLIEVTCKNLNIKCINIPNDHHRYTYDAAVRCADSMNYILNYQKQNVDKYLIIDSDMFLIDKFDIKKYENYHCAIVLQKRHVNYFWNGIYYFDFTRMKNIDKLNWNVTPGCDVGTYMQEWLNLQTNGVYPDTDEIRWTNKNFNSDTIYYIKHLWSTTWDHSEIPDSLKSNQKLINFLENDPRNQNKKFFCEIYDNVFLHYRCGGNWRNEGMSLHNQLSFKLKEALD